MRKFKPEHIPAVPEGMTFTKPTLPLDVEIGCGVGMHPIQYSGQNKDRFLVAIEHTKEKFDKFYRRFENHDCPSNLLPVHANAISWVTHLLEDEIVDRFIFMYPNPNPKAKDQNKRFHAMPFMEKVLACLKKDGLIIMATNEKFYADEAIEFMTQTWGMELVENREYGKQDGDRPRTHFEKKYLLRNETCYNLIFKKIK